MSLTADKVTRVVCGVLRDEAGRYLACRRDLQRHLGGKWEFPGGKIDAGESPEEALARELKEELGVTIQVGEKFRAVTDWSEGDVSICLEAYACDVVAGEIEALEHEELRWCKVSEFDGLDWAEADLPLVAELIGKG